MTPTPHQWSELQVWAESANTPASSYQQLVATLVTCCCLFAWRGNTTGGLILHIAPLIANQNIYWHVFWQWTEKPIGYTTLAFQQMSGDRLRLQGYEMTALHFNPPQPHLSLPHLHNMLPIPVSTSYIAQSSRARDSSARLPHLCLSFLCN